MKVRNIDINELIPYPDNPRHNDEAVEYVANSIREFGFKVPIVIDRDNVIIAGHTRLKAAKTLNMREVPCVIADDLTPEQAQAFRLADNRVAEAATWDFDKLSAQLADLMPEFDMSDFNFKVDMPELADTLINNDTEEDEIDFDYERGRMLKEKNILNLAYARYEGVGKYDIPAIRPVYHLPEVDEWVGFNYALSTPDPENKGVHFFVDDYQFERIWNNPDKYRDILSRFKAVLSPDFSPYGHMPYATQLFNHYRKHWCARYWQEEGITVIPTIRASADMRSLEWCFDGEPMGGVIAVSSMWSNDLEQENRRVHREIMKRLQPKTILVYGEIKPWHNKNEAEYVQIETFAESREGAW